MGRNEALRDLASFAATAMIAVWQGWIAKDIIWGLWISSLVIGYSFLVVMILSSFARGSFPMNNNWKPNNVADAIKAKRYGPIVMNAAIIFVAFMFFGPRSGVTWLVVLVCAAFSLLNIIVAGGGRTESGSALNSFLRRFAAITPALLFMLGFFTLHFGGFHFVHGLFLNGFFPLVEWNPAGESPDGVFSGFMTIIGKALIEYWPFVLFSAVSRYGEYRDVIATKREPNMMLPYLNVIRMHLLIFVFAGLHAAGLASYAVYPVLIFYFFPAGSILKALSVKARRVSRAGKRTARTR